MLKNAIQKFHQLAWFLLRNVHPRGRSVKRGQLKRVQKVEYANEVKNEKIACRME